MGKNYYIYFKGEYKLDRALEILILAAIEIIKERKREALQSNRNDVISNSEI